MSFQTLHEVQPTFFAFQFDGSPASITALNVRLVDSPYHASYVDPASWTLQYWNYASSGHSLGDVIVFKTESTGDVSQIADIFDSQAALAQSSHWTSP